MTASVRHPRCLDCGHVGNRAFDEEGIDVLSKGLRVENTTCHCGSKRIELVPEYVPQLSTNELKQLAEWGQTLMAEHGADLLPDTLERMRALRSKVLQLAFMETCRDA